MHLGAQAQQFAPGCLEAHSRGRVLSSKIKAMCFFLLVVSTKRVGSPRPEDAHSHYGLASPIHTILVSNTGLILQFDFILSPLVETLALRDNLLLSIAVPFHYLLQAGELVFLHQTRYLQKQPHPNAIAHQGQSSHVKL